MSGYTPKPGDRVHITFSGTVTSVNSRGCVGVNGYVYDADEVEHIELVEAAPVPFVVGEIVTEAMGEPPIHSVIGWCNNDSDSTMVWQRHHNSKWYAATDSDMVGDWRALLKAKDDEGPILLRLGDGSVHL